MHDLVEFRTDLPPASLHITHPWEMLIGINRRISQRRETGDDVLSPVSKCFPSPVPKTGGWCQPVRAVVFLKRKFPSRVWGQQWFRDVRGSHVCVEIAGEQ